MGATQPSILTGESISPNERATFDLGVRIGTQLSGGEILLLSGPPGAGNTILVKGIDHAIGLDE